MPEVCQHCGAALALGAIACFRCGRMVEREEYCMDILQQTAALRAAVDAVTLMLLEDHVAGCLTTAVRTGQAEVYTEEVMEVVRRSMGRPSRGGRSASDG